jgi:hypothetical protein
LPVKLTRAFDYLGAQAKNFTFAIISQIPLALLPFGAATQSAMGLWHDQA